MAVLQQYVQFGLMDLRLFMNEPFMMNHRINFPNEADATSFSDFSFPACYISSDRRLCSWAC